ncbi:hypothetical protein FQN60_001593 [Etheostoma spectabile]|uniref:Uncharacterized protein n=1 Tax=Etheostoma spectabile TaxID=54343 RepID=A0A5J5D4J5_9PERO|nr:hypothetical protein FQN60_001593 [Etheostoma spectabile]
MSPGVGEDGEGGGGVSHILNVAFGVENAFPDLFIYKTVSILDHPDADLLLHIQDCCDFIQQARNEFGSGCSERHARPDNWDTAVV